MTSDRRAERTRHLPPTGGSPRSPGPGGLVERCASRHGVGTLKATLHHGARPGASLPRGARRQLTRTARSRRPRSRHYPHRRGADVRAPVTTPTAGPPTSALLILRPPLGRRRPRSRHYPHLRAADNRAPAASQPRRGRRTSTRIGLGQEVPPTHKAEVAHWTQRSQPKLLLLRAQSPGGAGSRAGCRKSPRAPEGERGAGRGPVRVRVTAAP